VPVETSYLEFFRMLPIRLKGSTDSRSRPASFLSSTARSSRGFLLTYSISSSSETLKVTSTSSIFRLIFSPLICISPLRGPAGPIVRPFLLVLCNTCRFGSGSAHSASGRMPDWWPICGHRPLVCVWPPIRSRSWYRPLYGSQ